MSSQQPRNISENQINVINLIDNNWMQAIKGMYADKANEVIYRLSRMDEGVRRVMLGAIKWAHMTMQSSNNTKVLEIIRL